MKSQLTDEEKSGLHSLILGLDESMNQVVGQSTNRAFNLGCFVGLIPASVIVLTTYFVTGNSWLGAVVMIVLMSLGLVLFANLVALISRRNTLRRIIQDEISPEIEKAISDYELDLVGLETAVSEVLPPRAILREYFPLIKKLSVRLADDYSVEEAAVVDTHLN